MQYFLINLLFFTSATATQKYWWKHAVIYEVFLPSFQDSNGDGFGDLRGVISRLDHLVDLGVDAVWLTPFYKSPMTAFGYDISNFTEIDPIFGTFADFLELRRAMKKRGLKLIIDFVLNHSSHKHLWFLNSIKKIEPYTDYYVWHDPKGYNSSGYPIEPNNWLTVYDEPAWIWNKERKQFYLSQFTPTMPDLNLRNDYVVMEIKKALKFWMDNGADGVRLDAVLYLIEDARFRDEPRLHPNVSTSKELIHIYTRNQPETFAVLMKIRKYIDTKYNLVKGYERIILSEGYGTTKEETAYYGTPSHPIAHVPFNFMFVSINRYINASNFNSIIWNWLENMPPGNVPNWQIENHDNSRFPTRFTAEYANILTVAITLLPGITVLQQGQEINMIDGVARPDQVTNYLTAGRSPVQWDSSLNAGFTSARKPWFPVHPHYWRCNVERQKREKDSTYNFMKNLLKIKKTLTAKFGDFHSYVISDWVFAFTRSYKHKTLVIVLNLGTEMEIVDLHSEIVKLPSTLTILVGTPNLGIEKGNIVFSHAKFQLTPNPNISMLISKMICTEVYKKM